MHTPPLDTQAILDAWIPTRQWRPFPTIDDRQAWEHIRHLPRHQARIEQLKQIAQEMHESPWPQLKASSYAIYVRTGNRTTYEKPYFQRRGMLGAWTLMQCLEPEGPYLDDIMDAIWSICEESSWSLPAHAGLAAQQQVVDINTPVVDLFAAETAMVLAEASYLLKPQLDTLATRIVRRVHQEILHRIIIPLETRDDFRWFSGRNNWTPWCCCNILCAAMYVLEDTPRLVALAQKLMTPIQRYIDKAPSDGGSDEGASYWNVGHLMLAGFLDLLHERTQGRWNLFDHPKIAAMGRYILTAHIHGAWYVNFADGTAKPQPRPGMVHRFGQRINEPRLCQFALHIHHPSQLPGGFNSMSLHAELRNFFWLPDPATMPPVPVSTYSWLDQLQIMAARATEKTDRGLMLIIKGGHNNENHNHNDIGQFILCLDGQPVIVDPGVSAYTRDTFTPAKRYDIWCIRASGHNAPVVNGVEQSFGQAFHASDVSTRNTQDSASVSMNLASAYPAEAGLVSLIRQATLDRSDEGIVTIHDHYQLSASPGVFELNLHSPIEPMLDKPGQIRLPVEGRSLLLQYDPALLTYRSQIRTLTLAEDGPMHATWNGKLHHLVFTHHASQAQGRYTLRFVIAP